MPDAPTLRTSRLLLRPWRAEDLEPFARLTSDPRVMEHFPSLLTRMQSDALAARIERHFVEKGFGLWAVETPELAFAGYVGLATPAFQAHFTPCVEVGWRLAAQAWGRGYATEGAQAAVAFGFEAAGLPEIVAFTVPANVRSRRVMQKLGMTHDPDDDFDHPGLMDDERMRRHVLYRLRRPDGPAREAVGGPRRSRERTDC